MGMYVSKSMGVCVCVSVYLIASVWAPRHVSAVVAVITIVVEANVRA